MLYFLYHGVLWCYYIIAKDWCKSVQWCWFWPFLSPFACYVLLLSVNKCSCTVWVLFFGSISDFVSFFQVQTLILCLFASSQSVFTCPIRLCGQTAGWLGAFCLPTGSMRWVQWASHWFVLGWEVMIVFLDIFVCFVWSFCFFLNSAGLEPGSCCGLPWGFWFCLLMYSAS